MDETSIITHITGTFEGVETLTAAGTTYFFYGPDRMMPFVTLVTDDEHDNASDLNRPSVYRLNIGIRKATFLSLFGERPPLPGADDGGGSRYDFTALDQLMPHPVYGRQYWVCVLNPSPATFDTAVRPLLAEAHESAVTKQTNRAARR